MRTATPTPLRPPRHRSRESRARRPTGLFVLDAPWGERRNGRWCNLGTVSIVNWRSSVLSVAPRVTVASTWLVAQNHWLWSVLSLASFRRELRVDAVRKQIWLSVRRGWVTRITQLSVDAVDHIGYRYVPWVTQAFLSFRDRRLTLEAGDRLERFSVELVLRDGGSLPLFSFVGEGAVMSGAIGVLMGDDWLDLEGDQEEQSRQFVRHLMRLTGLGIGPRLPREVAERRGPRCPRCRQLNAPQPRCLYCGARLEGSNAAP